MHAQMSAGKPWTQLPSKLVPVLHPEIKRLILDEPEKILDLVSSYGSPINLLWPSVMQENIDAFRKVLDGRGLAHQIFYGCKVNKSRALMRSAIDAGVGVDVSSVYEMNDAIELGLAAELICATGPAKSQEFHRKLMECGSLISIDSLAELEDLKRAHEQCTRIRPARIILRFKPSFLESVRFGMTGAEILDCLSIVNGGKSSLDFHGFHFHLNGYDPSPRMEAIAELVPYMDAAASYGMPARVVDIGGGVPIRYVESELYESFMNSHSESDYRNKVVPRSFYPYGGEFSAESWLSCLLDMKISRHESVEDLFQRRNLIFALEPGRSLVDQTAVSVFRVVRVKKFDGERSVVFVEGSSFSACETWFSSEYLVDPLLVKRSEEGRCSSKFYIAGHSCLEDDVLTNRFIELDSSPVAGDLLVFANTSGYQMDLLENEFHRHPMPKKVVVLKAGDGSVEFFPENGLELK